MGKKILVIEDEEDIRNYIMTLFADREYETLGAGNGREGLEMARERPPWTSPCRRSQA